MTAVMAAFLPDRQQSARRGSRRNGGGDGYGYGNGKGNGYGNGNGNGNSRAATRRAKTMTMARIKMMAKTTNTVKIGINGLDPDLYRNKHRINLEYVEIE